MDSIYQYVDENRNKENELDELIRALESDKQDEVNIVFNGTYFNSVC